MSFGSRALLVAYAISLIGFPAFAGTCSVDARATGANRLGYYDIDGHLISVSKRSRMALRRSDSKSGEFAFYFPMATSRKGGMLLIKVIDYVDGRPDVHLPKNIQLSRSASKRYEWFGRYFLRDVKQLKLGTASASVLEYQLVNSLVERINPTGDLAKFLQSYAVGKVNRDIFSKELKKRVYFAFEDVILNLNDRQRRALNVAISNIPDGSFVRTAYAKIVSDSNFLKPHVSSVNYIDNLQARLYYYEARKAGSGLNVCFKHQPNSNVTRTRFVVVDNDAEDGKKAIKLGSYEINWRK